VSLLEPVFLALHDGDVRFVVVGGVAVVLHGHPRMTADLDVAIDLSVGSPERAIAALSALGLVPRLPVEATDFADPIVRSRWVVERNLMVFTMWDPAEPLRQVDIFASDPIPFEGLWQRAVEVQLASVIVRVASIPDLITMKRAAGRPNDLADIEALEQLQGGATT